MPKPLATQPVPGRINNSRWLLLSLAIVVLDQVSKLWIVKKFPSEYMTEQWLPFFWLTRRHNPGAAFSFLADAGPWKQYFFVGLAVVVCLWILVWLRRNPRGQFLMAVGLALVLGGALGNSIDRVAYGYVVDFLLFAYDWSPWEWANAWPAFNVADMAITGGVVFILLDGFFGAGVDEDERE